MFRNILAIVAFVTASYTGFSQDAAKESIDRGHQVYLNNCISCHMENGEGVEGTFPPLTKNEYITGDTKRLISIILQGQTGEITVNGKAYNMEMPAQSHLSDEEVADVLNYIRNSWGNKAKKPIAAAEVTALRK